MNKRRYDQLKRITTRLSAYAHEESDEDVQDQLMDAVAILDEIVMYPYKGGQ